MATQENPRLTMTVQFPHPVTAFALVLGGWFPLSLVGGHLLVLDKNVLGMLRLIHKGISTRSDVAANAWWLNFINSSSQTVNPVLCAFEGNRRSVPNFDEFRAEFLRLQDELAEYLPHARRVTYSPGAFGAVYEILNNVSARHQAETDFLIHAAPLIAEPTRDIYVRGKRDRIIALASDAGLIGRTPVVLAVLSCLYESRDGSVPSIGRKLIKPSSNYGPGAAHNAIWDLRALEFLVGASASNLGPVAVCTRDRAMGAFWCALNVRDPSWKNNSLMYNVTIDNKLFPRITGQEIEELAALVFAQS